MAKAITGFDLVDFETAASTAAAILDRISDAQSVIALDTHENEVNLSPCRPAMDGMHSVNSAEICIVSTCIRLLYTVVQKL